MSSSSVLPDSVTTLTCLLCNGLVTYVNGNPRKFFKHLQHNHDVHVNHNFLLKMHLVKKDVIENIISENIENLDMEPSELSINEEGCYASEVSDDILLSEGSDYKHDYNSEHSVKIEDRFTGSESFGKTRSTSGALH